MLDADCLALVFLRESLPHLQYLKRVSGTFRAMARRTLTGREWLAKEIPNGHGFYPSLLPNRVAMIAEIERARSFALPLRLIWYGHTNDIDWTLSELGGPEGPLYDLMLGRDGSHPPDGRFVPDRRFVTKSLEKDDTGAQGKATATLEELTLRPKKWIDPFLRDTLPIDAPGSAIVDGFEIVSIRISVDGLGVFTDALELAPLTPMYLHSSNDQEDLTSIQGGVTAFYRLKGWEGDIREGELFRSVRWSPITEHNASLCADSQAHLPQIDTSDGLGCWQALPDGMSTNSLKGMDEINCPLLSNLLHAGVVPRGVTVLPASRVE